MLDIFVLTPIARSPMPGFVNGLLTLSTLSGVNVKWVSVRGQANTPRARNILAYQALEHGADSVLFIDDDIEFTAEAIEEIYSHKVPVVAGAPQRRDEAENAPVRFCASVDPDPKRHGRLVSGQAATAFMRIDACVLTHLRDEVFAKRDPVTVEVPEVSGGRLVVKEHRVQPGFFTYENMDSIPAWFDYRIAPVPYGRGVAYQGEDYYFSDLCRSNGIDVWIDPEIRLKHWNMTPLTACLGEHV